MEISDKALSEAKSGNLKATSKRNNEKYVDKINGLIGRKVYPTTGTSSVKHNKDKETTNTVMSLTDVRREKNKESAKNTRKRKKIYTELLENKIKELQVELGFVKEQVKLAKINQSHDVMMKVIYGFKNLNERTFSDHLDTAKEKLELMRSSFMQIPERKQLIQTHIEQFIEQCQTPFSRYFINTANQKKGFFSEAKEELSGPARFLKDSLTLNKHQLQDLKMMQPAFEYMAAKFKKHDDHLSEITEEIYNLSDTMDRLVENLVNYLAFQTIENFYSIFRLFKSTTSIEKILFEGVGLPHDISESKEDCSLSVFEDITLGKRKPQTDELPKQNDN